jgi:hypothetical protein
VTTRRTLVVGAWLIGVAGAVALLFAAGTATDLTGGQISPIFVAVDPTGVGVWLRPSPGTTR